MNITCKYQIPWVGKCNRPTIESNFCKEHSGLKCCMCDNRATRGCEETFQLVCGAPLCDSCNHNCNMTYKG